MIETASLTIPSPNTKLKSFGYFFGLRRETAAMTSVEQRSEHMSKISIVERLTVEVILKDERQS